MFMHHKGLLDIPAFQDTRVHVLEELLDILVFQYTLILMLEELELERKLVTEDFHIPAEEESTATDTEGTLEPLKGLGKHGLTVMQARAQPRPMRCGLQ